MKDEQSILKFIEDNFKDNDFSVVSIVLRKTDIPTLKDSLGESNLTLIALLAKMNEETLDVISSMGENSEDWQRVEIVFGSDDFNDILEVLRSNGWAVGTTPEAQYVLDFVNAKNDDGQMH